MNTISNKRLQKILEEMEEYAGTLSEDAKEYWNYHKDRFVWTIELIKSVAIEKNNQIEKILDIGNSYQTIMMSKYFLKKQIDTLGFLDSRYLPDKDSTHIEFDLNKTQEKNIWPRVSPKYYLVVMLEVIEHLAISPKHVLFFLNSLLNVGGYLIIQTPNAVSLRKRVEMLIGKQPFELIREDLSDYGQHFREYTVKELKNYANETGFEVKKIIITNYFSTKNERLAVKLFDKIELVLPKTFRNGITMIMEKNRTYD
jgi:hypothetical protein